VKHKNIGMGDTSPLIDILHRELTEIRCGVEVGVYRGDTSALLLRSFPLLRLVMVDSWAVYPEDHPYRKSGDGCARQTAEQQQANFDDAMQTTEFAKDRRLIMVFDSVRAAESWNIPTINPFHEYPLDFGFLDDDHTYEGVRSSILAWWSLIREDGILAGHDWNHPRVRKGFFGVNQAVEEFADRIGQKVNVEGQVWWLRKTVESGDGE